ncbi:OmpA family protein [Thetidibacter halocola]|uniref:OmpA family protein n=1 Tax=Thetidibacter halocola TaxID=2827239 RepID=UPI0020126D21|nr:OmpA family protein [Thetidibacter halocola]
MALLVAAGSGAAQDLALPANARLTEEQARDPGSYALPTGPWAPGEGLPVRSIEGPITLQAFRLDGSGLTPLQLMAPLRTQLEQAGWTILLDCAGRGCGGFDFRFATEVIPAPAMYVDLSAYRFLSALSPDGAGLSVLTSRDRGSGYVQIVRAGQAAPAVAATAPQPTGPVTPAPTAATGSLAEALEARGHAVLPGLDFSSGSAGLGEGPVAALEELAQWLRANPSRQVLLVGHTDATGSLETNRALSKRRAQEAVDYLAARGIPGAQIGAEGAGYLAPVASNLTAAGREANRRVEVVVISTE